MELQSDRASALETAACLWEAVLTLRDRPATHPDTLSLAMAIGESFKVLGTAALRMTVIDWTDAVAAAWAKVADDYPLCFDWDFVPGWIADRVDWSNPGNPVIREELMPVADETDGPGGEGEEGGGDKHVAANPEAFMTFPAQISTSVGQTLLSKITRFFNGSIGDCLAELIQNSRRAGATRIDIDAIENDGRASLRIRDDGRGIADPAKFLRLGDSGWDEDIARSEDPAGMGVFSLAGRHVTVRSYAADIGEAWQASITPDAWESGDLLDVMPAVIEKGTEIEIELPEAWAKALGQAVKDAARFCPVAVWFGGERQPKDGFLREAVRVEEWNGCRIGVFVDRHHIHRELVRINFHGLTVPCTLPHIVDADGGRGWYTKVDIVDAPDLRLVLPARKEMVQNAALDALREACEAAIFRTIAHEGYHRLPFAKWQRAQQLGITLPEAVPWLYAWTPCVAEAGNACSGERVAGEAMILMMEDEPHIEQCAARAFASGTPLGATPVEPLSAFAGYPWYDALPRVIGYSFRIERGYGEFLDYAADAQVPPDLESGRVVAIELELAVRQSSDPAAPVDVIGHPADAVIIPGEAWSELDEVVVLLSADCAITPIYLATLLENALFCSSEDCEADSYHTQEAAFEMQARFVANRLLLGEDAAVIARIEEAMREHVSWLIPLDRAVAVQAAGYQVSACFADNDETAVPAAAE